MPARTDLTSILVVGSGPIVIGQACEFDYSGTQACRALQQEGYRVVLVNSNPATIMTDPERAAATYIEPITADYVAAVIERERPDALLPTLGGQTALNVAMELHSSGTLDAFSVELIGASAETIRRAEDRRVFKETMAAAGLSLPRSAFAYSVPEAAAAAEEIGLPVIIRPSYVLGGGGSGVVSDLDSVRRVAAEGLRLSSIGEVLVEESIEGWREFELELMRDRNDNVVVVCSIENLDPMGVHTGDSVTVAPAMTLTDVEYQAMRDDGIRVMRAVGVETGGSNVQFAVEPATGRRVVIEMNPRVSRSSALASKATGFPIAKIAAKLAVGYSLDEIPNDITGVTPASFEPSIDYVAVKLPRFSMEKFPASGGLGTKMKSVGEVMAMGRTFLEALGKGRRSLEPEPSPASELSLEQVSARLAEHHPERLELVERALELGLPPDEVASTARLSPWFVAQLERLVEGRCALRQIRSLEAASKTELRRAKRLGLSDSEIASCLSCSEAEVRARRKALGVLPSYKTVDTCAAEFEAKTPYFYSTWEEEDETPPSGERTVIILGSGPNRIGQGIEFDYCCVHASLALQEAGFDAVMINCNPETVSTDYDTSTRLYLEPLTLDHVMAVIAKENPQAVIVQLGGQTPLKLARDLEAAGVTIAGTSPDAIDVAEDRERFSQLCRTLDVPQPEHGTATSAEKAGRVSAKIGYPVLVRPSYVLGGRAMRIIYSKPELVEYLAAIATPVQGEPIDLAKAPLLIDRFIEGATEIDVDAIFDGADLYVGGIMEHVEEAGVHSGDSACVIPPPTLAPIAHRHILEYTEALARGLDVCGLLNIQFAVQGDAVFVLEANPRASRTVPFVSKATGVPLAKIATRVMMGESVEDLRRSGLLPPRGQPHPAYSAVKEAVLPWDRFPAEDTILGPEMRSTGEVMGIGTLLGTAYAKALLAAGTRIPEAGTLFLSLADRDKENSADTARIFSDLGFRILATSGTAETLKTAGIPASHVDKVGEGSWDPVRLIENGLIDIVINTPHGRRARGDGALIRRAATRHGIACITTLQGGHAVALSLRSGRDGLHDVKPIQRYHERSLQ